MMPPEREERGNLSYRFYTVGGGGGGEISLYDQFAIIFKKIKIFNRLVK